MQSGDSSSQTISGALIVQEQQARAQTRGLVRTFTALRHHNYRLFFFGQMISLIETWMQTTAQAWLVLELTHSALLLSKVFPRQAEVLQTEAWRTKLNAE